MLRPLSIVAGLVLLVAAFSVTAQDPAPTAAQSAPTAAPAPAAPAAPAAAAPAAAPAAAGPGDASRGKALTYTCRGCHGLTGYKNAYPSYHVPRIGGQSSTYLRNALNEYRNGNRQHPTMQAQAESFSEQDINDIAAYLSSVK
ncbi:MAG: c-type cytochrome [Thermomonas sp.]|nr:c-type cytochrome [Thermomonas sp.]